MCFKNASDWSDSIQIGKLFSLILNLTFRQIFIKGCRHPIVELQENCSYIPNDVHLTDKSLLHIITGPNMGGKSTYLRRSEH